DGSLRAALSRGDAAGASGRMRAEIKQGPRWRPASIYGSGQIGQNSGDLNLTWLALFALVQGDVEEAIGKLGIHLLNINGRRKSEAAQEAVITALLEQPVAFLLVLFLAFGGDGQGLVFQSDVHIFFPEARQLNVDVQVVGIFADVYRVWGPALAAA